jgi:hypothetical protein
MRMPRSVRTTSFSTRARRSRNSKKYFSCVIAHDVMTHTRIHVRTAHLLWQHRLPLSLERDVLHTPPHAIGDRLARRHCKHTSSSCALANDTLTHAHTRTPQQQKLPQRAPCRRRERIVGMDALLANTACTHRSVSVLRFLTGRVIHTYAPSSLCKSSASPTGRCAISLSVHAVDRIGDDDVLLPLLLRVDGLLSLVLTDDNADDIVVLVADSSSASISACCDVIDVPARTHTVEHARAYDTISHVPKFSCRTPA